MSRKPTILRSAGPIIAPSFQTANSTEERTALGLEDSMRNGLAAMQAMALKYLDLARTARDPQEGEKLQRYAALYQEIAAQTGTTSETAIEQSLSSSAL
jgi:hypothetical protein